MKWRNLTETTMAKLPNLIHFTLPFMTLTDLYQSVDCGHGIPTGLLLVVPAQHTKLVLIGGKSQTQIQEYFIKWASNYKCSEL